MNIISAFLEICKTYPQKNAIEKKGDKYSFSELLTVSRKYAYLIKQNETVNKAIGIVCTREIETLPFIVGVLFSGNYYVPINPDMPKGKIQAILEDANIETILGTNQVKCDFLDSLDFSGRYISDDDIQDAMCDIPSFDDDKPLYMIYTSGSTGKPKGVLKSHKAELSFVNAYFETFDFSESEIIGNQTPFFFDAAAKDIYLTLVKGLTLEMIPSELFSLPPELIDYLNEKKITFASWVPTVLSIVAQLNPFSLVKPTTLKKVFFVGEVMPMKHLNKWRENLPDIQYVNLYGQSELCGICCYYDVKESFSNDSALPMGKPLKNCKIYLLDKEKVITEPNIIGEMYVVSDALALEYFNDVQKTNESFTYKDFGNGMERCFKTGDLAQYDNVGNLVFAARSDFQIKHMGYRIELGEIETIAGALDCIARCCCLYNQEKKKIVLFCELISENIKSGQEIKSELKTKLASYMVPGKVVILEKIPLNANGKIDRNKLKQMLN